MPNHLESDASGTPPAGYTVRFTVADSSVAQFISGSGSRVSTLTQRPPDEPDNIVVNSSGARYPVASFHTHTPVEYIDTIYGWIRFVGPSWEDNDNDLTDRVPGIVYDYIEASPGSGRIPLGHPKDAPAKRYKSGFNRRYYWCP